MTKRRTTLIAGVIIAGAAIATVLLLASGGGRANPTDATGATATAAVVRTTLASQEQVSGTLQPAASYTLVAQQPTGTVSGLPAPGTVIARGESLYRVDGQPVRLLYGEEAEWRTLALGVAAGADVLQLKRNLRAFGFTADGTLKINDDFDWATAIAIDEWQRAQGTLQTGILPLGSIAFLPGPVRVSSQLAVPGSPVQPGTQLLAVTSTHLAVSVPLDPALRQLVHVGDRVQIQLPEGQSTPGRVIQVGADVAAAAGQAPAAGPGSASAASTTQDSSGGPSATVPVAISLDRPRDAQGLAQVPVQVRITDAVHRNVLAVPITALVALAGGGYAVAIDDGATRTLTAVTPGLFNGNLVEVSSSRLGPGMRVEVASS